MIAPTAPLPDAAKTNWVDRWAPAHMRPWLKLGRFDRPIGIWLLFLPGAMGLFFAIARPYFTIDGADPNVAHIDEAGLAHHFPLYFLVLFAVGAALMRAAGCAFNDLVDRDIDAKVERTRNRPVASGQITPKQAIAFIVACSLVSFGILIQLGTLAIILGIASLALVAAYPFMKRITWWPQAWLGITFNWGFPMAVAAVNHDVSPAAIVFYIGLIFWTLGYDTIYAIQDLEDDAMVGIRSSTRRLGRHAVTGVSIFYGLAVVLTGAAGRMAGLPPLFFGGLLLVTLHLFSQVARMRLDDGAGALKLFKANRTTGLLWVVSLLLVHVPMHG
ncbi:MAG: 4-hydroxybenzoate octaprenyltransferase [Asticcacaulis sp.]|nr:4-hydroxybenzoate octaprenyltransferase [Asticcacaulis sp.]